MPSPLSLQSYLSEHDAIFGQARDNLVRQIPAKIPGGLRESLLPDLSYQGVVEGIRSSMIDELSTAHSHLLDKNLNRWVDTAKQALATEETKLRIAFYDLDIRRQVKPGFLLDFVGAPPLNDIGDPFNKVLKVSVPLAVIVAAVITVSPLPTLPLALLVGGGGGTLTQYLVNKGRKQSQLAQMEELITALCKQEQKRSEALIEQARERFGQVFDDFRRRQGVSA
jgi:hypothetical protein